MIRLYLLLFILSNVFISSTSLGLEPSKIDKRAQSIAKLLKPASFGKGSEKDLGGVRGQVIRLIEEMEKSERTNHSSPDSMISKAYQFRVNEIGRTQAMVASRSLLSAWREANALGLFDKNGKFSDRISRGSGSGQKAVFEYIVPPSVAPDYSKFIGNVRLVRKDRARVPDAEISMRDKAFINSLEQVKREARTFAAMKAREKGADFNEVGQSSGVELERYNAEVKAAGALVDQEPGIRLSGKLMSRPSHMSKNRYRVDFEVMNTSRHPTEVTLEYYIIGQTEKLNQNYVMTKSSQKLKLRSGQSKKIEVWTQPINAYSGKVFALTGKKSKKVSYLGYIATVKFGNKGSIATSASNARLLAHANGDRDGLTSWPVF